MEANNNIEIWKDIKDFEGLYQVSNLGRVRSLDRPYHKGKILTPAFDGKKNYLFVGLHKNKVVKQKNVHRLVAETFIDNPNNYPCINHIDENKTNNHVENLEWCTIKYNSNYGNGKERMILSRKSNKNYQDSLLRGQETRNRLKCSGAEKQVLQYTLDGMFLHEWKSMTEAERQLGISRCGIAKCCKGIFKQFKGYKWIWK